MRWGPTISVSDKDVVDTVRYVDGVTSFSLFDAVRKRFATTRRLDLGSSFIVESVSTGYDMAAVDHGMVAFTLPLNGAVIREIGDRQIKAVPGDFQLLFPSRRKTIIRQANGRPFRALTYFAPLTLLQRHLDASTAGSLNIQTRNLAKQSELSAGAAVATYMKQIANEIERHPKRKITEKDIELGECLLGELLAELLSRRQIDVSPGRPAPWRIVREVEERMWASHAEPITIADLARSFGVGVRSLQLAFIAHRGKSPKTFLSEIRLREARAMLIAARPGETVASVALACGIAHFGRFAAVYRQKYGESPSQTLAKVRAF